MERGNQSDDHGGEYPKQISYFTFTHKDIQILTFHLINLQLFKSWNHREDPKLSTCADLHTAEF